MRRSVGVGWLSVGLSCGGCATTRFVPLDGSYGARPGTAEPELFIYVVPTAPYRIVGHVEATSDDGLTDEVLRGLRDEGRAAGCDLLVDERIVPKRGRHDVGVVVRVHRKGNLRDTVKRLDREPPPSHVYRFGCGRWGLQT